MCDIALGDVPVLHLAPQNTKARRRDGPTRIHPDLLTELRHWVAGRLDSQPRFALQTDRGKLRSTARMMPADWPVAAIDDCGDFGSAGFRTSCLCLISRLCLSWPATPSRSAQSSRLAAERCFRPFRSVNAPHPLRAIEPVARPAYTTRGKSRWAEKTLRSPTSNRGTPSGPQSSHRWPRLERTFWPQLPSKNLWQNCLVELRQRQLTPDQPIAFSKEMF